MVRFGWPYGQSPGTGAWGTPSSNANFCEEDYIITTYIAEFVNTLTNLTYVIYGVCGIRSVLPHKEGGLLSTLALPYWGLIAVGLLSGWFHATLNYHSQMGDDLSMFFAVGALLYQLRSVSATSSQRRVNALLILGALIPVSAYHCWTDEIIVHEIVFAAMVVLCAVYTRRLIRDKVQLPAARKKLASMATFGLATGVFGYFLWNIDYHFCPQVRAVRRSLGLPWGFALELHGWWHIFTGIGAYVGMATVQYLVTRDKASTTRDDSGFVWPVSVVLQSLDVLQEPSRPKTG